MAADITGIDPGLQFKQVGFFQTLKHQENSDGSVRKANGKPSESVASEVAFDDKLIRKTNLVVLAPILLLIVTRNHLDLFSC
jgi:hypothetical protein